MQPIGGSLSRGVGPVCARTGVVVGPTYFIFLEGCGVDSWSTLLVLWCDMHDWDCQGGILACLYLFLLTLGMPWCCVPRLSPFLAVGIPVENGSGFTIPDRSCVLQYDLLMWAFGVRGGHLISGVHNTAEVWIWCGWSMRLRSWHAPPIMGCQWQWWWCYWWIHPLRPHLPWY